jgi:hypothetical protein
VDARHKAGHDDYYSSLPDLIRQSMRSGLTGYVRVDFAALSSAHNSHRRITALARR